jgi:hypothetical protein
MYTEDITIVTNDNRDLQDKFLAHLPYFLAQRSIGDPSQRTEFHQYTVKFNRSVLENPTAGAFRHAAKGSLASSA